MSVKYHISTKTQQPAICRAQPGNCPIRIEDGSETEHFSTREEAEKHIEKTNEAAFGAIPEASQISKGSQGRSSKVQSKTYDLKKRAEFFEASGEKNAYTRVSVEIEPKSDGSGESNLTIGAYDQNDEWHELENWTDFNPEKDSIKDAEAWDEWGIEPPTE